MPIIELAVTGMTCGHCVKAVTEAIHRRDPAARVAVALETGLVSVETRLDRAEVATLIRAEGYKVQA